MTTYVEDLIFVATNGHVRALDKRTGEDQWELSLPSTGFDIVTLLCEPGVLYAASKGYVFAINPKNGNILWKNNLKWMGTQHVTLATMGRAATPLLPFARDEEARRDEATKEDAEGIVEKFFKALE